MRVLALDYGVARTGVALSDVTGTLARPFTVVSRASSKRGLARIAGIVSEEHVDRVVVGLPVSLDSCEHRQAREVRGFVARLRAVVTVPVETYDERFTTKLAKDLGGTAGLDARAAAVLLEEYLRAMALREEGEAGT